MIFKKVSFYQYCKDANYDVSLWESKGDIIYTKKLLEEKEKKHTNYQEWATLPLPRRGTTFSAGYDFTSPIEIQLEPNQSATIPTGIAWECREEMTTMRPMGAVFVLKIYPRSGLGFKYQLGLKNTVGIIDMDYWISDNEGHILIGLVNNGDKPMTIKKGERFVQGIIENVWVVEDDNPKLVFRNGGFGSTDEQPPQVM